MARKTSKRNVRAAAKRVAKKPATTARRIANVHTAGKLAQAADNPKLRGEKNRKLRNALANEAVRRGAMGSKGTG